jgi:hypothetical protein
MKVGMQLPKPPGKHRKQASSQVSALVTHNQFDPLSVEDASDTNDNDYEAKESSSSAFSTDIEEITNEEVYVCDFYNTSSCH